MILLGLEVLVGTYIGTQVKSHFSKNTSSQHTATDPKNHQQLIESNQSSTSSEIAENEVQTNRYLNLSGVAVGLAAARFVYPPLLIPALILASYTTIPILKESKSSLDDKKIKNDLLNALVIVSCFATGYYLTVALVAGYYHLANKMVMKTKDRSEKMLKDIFGQQVDMAWIIVDGIEVNVPLESIKIDDVVVVGMGETIPVDGEIIDGIAMIDEHILTGEAMPVEKIKGAEVFASTLILSGKIQIKVKQTGSDTNIAKINQLFTDTTEFKSDVQTRAETIANDVATPLLASSILLAPFIGIPAATTILYSSPGNTIKLLASLQTLNKLAQAYQKGLLIKDGRALEALLNVDTVFFDKTGTLTSDQPVIGKIITFDEFSEQQVLAYSAAAEHKLTHPIALAILAEARAQNLDLPPVHNANYKMSYGISVESEGKNIKIGSSRFMNSENINLPTSIHTMQQHCDHEGYSLVLLAVNNTIKGAIEIQPQVRPEAEEVIKKLRTYGINHIAIVSGDRELPTRKLAEKLAMDAYYHDCLPQDKAQLIEQLQQQGKRICFIGDGINDAIAMKQADVSVSMFGATSISTDAAQVVLMSSGLNHLPYLFENAKELSGKIKQTLLVSAGYSVSNIFGAVFLHATVLFSFLVAGGFYVLGGIEYAAAKNNKQAVNKLVDDHCSDTS